MKHLAPFLALSTLAALLIAWPHCAVAEVPVVEWVAKSPGQSGQAVNRRQCAFPAPGAIAADADGNTVLAGCSRNGFSDDILVVKRSAAGDVIWLRRFDGPAGFNDRATALALDASGNVYVSGFSGSSTEQEFVTLKYDLDGELLWSATYDGVAHGGDVAADIAVDASGNVYVTGHSELFSEEFVFTTIKYGTGGERLWVAIDGRPLFQLEFPEAMALDASGNIYVTGQQHSDIATAKYSPSGELLWVATYDGAVGGYDSGLDIVVSPDGTSVVTGAVNQEGDGEVLDYAVISYSPGGQQLWVAEKANVSSLSEPWLWAASAIDVFGNVCVTGKAMTAAGDYDWWTAKFDALGHLLWQRTEGTSGLDFATGLAVNSDGDVFVVGQIDSGASGPDFAVAKYDSMGNKQWLVSHSEVGSADLPYAVVLDASNDVIVAGISLADGSSAYSHRSVKYSSDGVEQWIASNPTEQFPDETIAMTSDAAGNTYLAGKSFNGLNFDFRTLKFSSDGSLLWARSRDGVAGGDDTITTIAVDAAGNVLVAGSSKSGTGDTDFMVVKYNAAGVEQWTAVRDGGTQGDDAVSSIALDSNGNAVVTGPSAITPSNVDFLTIKLSPSGSEEWANGYGGSSGGGDTPRALAIDSTGSIYVTGSSRGIGGSSDFATMKYSPDGALLWTDIFDGADHLEDWPAKLVIDASDNVYLAGSSQAPSDLYRANFVTIKYAPHGGRVWVNTHDGGLSNDSDDQATALAVDVQGSVYVSGYSVRNYDGLHNYLTIKIDGDGATLWQRKYDGTANRIDVPVGIAVASNGDVYVTGQSMSSEGSRTIATVKYDSLGSELWVHRWEGVQGLHSDAAGVQVLTDSSVVVGGTVGERSYSSRMVALRLMTGANGHVVSVSTGGGTGYGIGTPSWQIVQEGGSGSFVVTPAINNRLASVAGDTCSPALVGSVWVTGEILDACHVTAEFVSVSADLSVSVDGGPAFAHHGDVVTYEITVENPSDAPVYGSSVSADPGFNMRGLEWVCLPFESSAPCPAAPLNAGEWYLDSIVDLPAASHLRFRFSVELQGSPGELMQLYAGISAPYPVDWNSANNSAFNNTRMYPVGVFADGFEGEVVPVQR